MKKAKNQDANAGSSKLRADAENALKKGNLHHLSFSDKDIHAIFQELQVHQIELEMQNDELQITNLELERQRVRFAGLFDLAPVGYFLLDMAGIIKNVNHTGLGLLKGERESMIGRRFHSLIARTHSDIFYKFFMEMLNAQSPQQCELKIISKNGDFYARLEGMAIKNASEPFECYIAVVDISERILAEQQLREAKERLEMSLRASQAGIWELDFKRMRFLIDDNSKRICNLPLDGFDGDYLSFINLIHPDDREETDRQFRESINRNKEIDVICRLGAGAKIACHTVIRGHILDTDEAQKRFVGIIMDITDKMLMEEYSQRLKAEYQKKISIATLHTEEKERRRISEALHDSVGQLLYGAKMKLGQFVNNDQAVTEINNVHKLLDQAIRETRNISFELAPSILSDFGLPATVAELVKRLSTKKMRITARVNGFSDRMDLLFETNIYRILQELMNNCIKHADANLITIVLNKDTCIEISVKDNGVGFNVKDHQHLLHGSGLSSIKNRLSLYNGSLDITSQLGKGTVVTVILQYPA